MNRNTTRFAFAEKCGWRGVRGFDRSSVFVEGEANALPKKPSRERRSNRARPANPPATSQRNSRRLLPQGVGLGEKRVVTRRIAISLENPLLGGVARSDSGREAPGWVSFPIPNPPQGLTALAPPERGFAWILLLALHRKADERADDRILNSLPS